MKSFNNKVLYCTLRNTAKSPFKLFFHKKVVDK